MYIETLIKARQNTNTNWCPDPETDYVRLLIEGYRADGRLVDIVHQISEDQLQHTRTMLFRTQADRDSYFSDPIVAALETRTQNYDLINQISSRIITDTATR